MDIYLRKCNSDDFDKFYFLKCDKENVYWTGYVEEPNKKQLEKWFEKQLERNDRIIFLAEKTHNNEVVGYLYLDIIEDDGGIVEIGYGAHSKFSGNRIGSKILDAGIEYVKREMGSIKLSYAWILEYNIRSIKCAIRSGYLKSKEQKSINIQNKNGEQIMNKYIYEINRDT